MFSIDYLENAWSSKQMITEGEAAIPLETTRRAFRKSVTIKTKISFSSSVRGWITVLTLLNTNRVKIRPCEILENLLWYILAQCVRLVDLEKRRIVRRKLTHEFYGFSQSRTLSLSDFTYLRCP